MELDEARPFPPRAQRETGRKMLSNIFYEIFILQSDQFKPKSYLKLIKKYVFSEGQQFPFIKLQPILLRKNEKVSFDKYGIAITHPSNFEKETDPLITEVR